MPPAISTTATRRQTLGTLGAALIGAALPARIAHAAIPGARRNLVFLNLRGAADGLAIVMPTGDPALRTHRAALVDGALQDGPGTRLDGLFTLHPALAQIGRRYAAGQAIVAHAVASSYRERSHFDAQNILETGGLTAYAANSGWLNRLAPMLSGDQARALAIGATLPPVLRGPAPASSFAPSALPDTTADFVTRVTRLYTEDAQLHGLLETALATRAMAGVSDGAPARSGAELGTLAARLMLPGGARPGEGDAGSAGSGAAHLVAMEIDGWDTHNGQTGRLTTLLRQLDALVDAMASGLGAAWADTLVIVATEFGRTVAMNGTGGTDHGTGSAAFLLGGAVRGGRVLADWPGLSPARLRDGRDLAPTTALESLIASAAAQHFALDPGATARALYPAHQGLAAIDRLIA
jgi:uncharacterized protein (DUF1501 family)